MIVCKQCGHHNEDSDTFCGSCGKFLEWTGERVVVAEPEPEPVAAEAEAPPEAARPGLFERVKQAVGIEETTTSAAVEAPAPPTEAPTPVAAPEPVLAGVGAPTAQAAPVAPVEEPLSRRPTSIAPTLTRPRPGPRTMEPPSRRNPGDLICGQCGEGNDPTRHFCRRCGNSLVEAIAVRQPWYRRFFNRVFGVRTREAGWRPHRVGPPNVLGMVWRIVRLAAAALIVVAVLAFLLVPSFHKLVSDRATATFTAVRKAVRPNYDPVYPIGASASTAIANHPPTLAMDRFSNTYWAALRRDPAPVLVLRFNGPQDLSEIGFRSGASGTAPADAFLAQPRPHLVHLVFSNGYATDVSLKDQDATQSQFYPIDDGKADGVTFVEIHVMSQYAPAGASSSSVAITEVEFKIKD